jgi:hypothetical protein
MGISCESITNDPIRVVIVRRGEFDDKIHGYGCPWARWDVEGLEQAIWLVTRGFDATTGVTGFYIAPDISLHARP